MTRKERTEEWKKRGMCTACSASVAQFSTKCEKCLAYYRKYKGTERFNDRQHKATTALIQSIDPNKRHPLVVTSSPEKRQRRKELKEAYTKLRRCVDCGGIARVKRKTCISCAENARLRLLRFYARRKESQPTFTPIERDVHDHTSNT